MFEIPCTSIAANMSLPDPTEDLDWGGYVGAIHELFHKNAVAHPDRPCVTETKTSK